MRKEELKEYLKMQTELNRLKDKTKECREKLESPKLANINRIKGGEQTDFTDYFDDLILLQKNYNIRAKAIIHEQLRIEQAISSLVDPVERAVLGYRYIDGLTWEKICVKIEYEWAQVHRIHGEALKNILEISKHDTQ